MQQKAFFRFWDASQCLVLRVLLLTQWLTFLLHKHVMVPVPVYARRLVQTDAKENVKVVKAVAKRDVRPLVVAAVVKDVKEDVMPCAKMIVLPDVRSPVTASVATLV